MICPFFWAIGLIGQTLLGPINRPNGSPSCERKVAQAAGSAHFLVKSRSFNSRQYSYSVENTSQANMFSRIFGKPREETSAVVTLDKLNETLEMLEKKEQVLMKKAAGEIGKAKEFTRAKNKRAAIQCLKKKKLYEQQIEQLGSMQLRIHDQMILLEGAKATTETVDALRSGAAAMKAMHKATNIEDVDKTMDEINEQTENMKQIQEALSAPIGAAADFDEDELEAELEELEGRDGPLNRSIWLTIGDDLEIIGAV
ncbi:hypothetical protein Nepgr_005573 [Nepenthes gracilis]|uniref:Uncharacterized protein n=1 Tax=Nepenthes gracilis TaxID=150966 RepID=A0AAD3XGH1_NEPGR|nr:hypothetical protein Nepgr_005573 [Nepenthes gracilis]